MMQLHAHARVREGKAKGGVPVGAPEVSPMPRSGLCSSRRYSAIVSPEKCCAKDQNTTSGPLQALLWPWPLEVPWLP